MAIYDLNRSHGDAISTRIAHRIVDAVIRVIDARDARATERTLSRMTDHELWDIGVSRSDIARIGRRR